jgi:hypothetical protein
MHPFRVATRLPITISQRELYILNIAPEETLEKRFFWQNELALDLPDEQGD